MTNTRPATLGVRSLNRATLDRQLLLERAAMDALGAVDHLVGLQAQAPLSPYYQLWSRLTDFDPVELGQHLLDRRVVRTVAMRGTLHLLTAEAGMAIRLLIQSVIDRDLRTNTQRRADFARLDRDTFVQAARDLLSVQALTSQEIGVALAESFPHVERDTLGYAARGLLALVQVPPRAVWGHSGQPRWQTIESWLDRADWPALDIDTLVVRYLQAFGPASVADAQTWSGLTRLNEVVDRLRPNLVVFRDDDGRELFDLPHANRPDPDTPAPVRFLPDFDNIIRSHANRGRFVDPGAMKVLNTRNAVTPSTVLVDGRVAGTWRIEKTSDGVRLTVAPFHTLATSVAEELIAEGNRLLAFAHPQAAATAIELSGS